jgi:hypothetical protein
MDDISGRRTLVLGEVEFVRFVVILLNVGTGSVEFESKMRFDFRDLSLKQGFGSMDLTGTAGSKVREVSLGPRLPI